MIISSPHTDVGVVIGRFQVHDLHPAHVDLLDGVTELHPNVMILVGVSSVTSTRDPLDFKARRDMIAARYPNAVIEPMYDIGGDDAAWSKSVDRQIRGAFPHKTACIYGGRDSFIPHYSGVLPTVQVESLAVSSGTDVRDRLRAALPNSADARAGVIYATSNRWPMAWPTVDILIWNRKGEVLLIRRPGTTAWRMIGGFFDITQDQSLEEAARREAYEESGLEIGPMEHLFSSVVDDPRYREGPDGLLTTVFASEYLWGAPKSLDPDEPLTHKWFPVDSIPGLSLVPEHRAMIVKAIPSLRTFIHQAQNGSDASESSD